MDDLDFFQRQKHLKYHKHNFIQTLKENNV